MVGIYISWRKVYERTVTKKLVLSGLFLALGLVMPFLTAQIPSVGSRLLPMHIPVLLCGFICGWPYADHRLIVPVFRSMLFGMPPMLPTAVAMAFELAAYGCMSGLLHKLLREKYFHICIIDYFNDLRKNHMGNFKLFPVWIKRNCLYMGAFFGWRIPECNPRDCDSNHYYSHYYYRFIKGKTYRKCLVN